MTMDLKSEISEVKGAAAQLQPLVSQARLVELQMAAAADEHIVIAPTHIMERNGEIIGYLSLGAMPVVQAWFHSQKCRALDSVRMIRAGEQVFREIGVKQYCVGVSEHSPFAPHMGRLGYTRLLTNTLWRKTL